MLERNIMDEPLYIKIYVTEGVEPNVKLLHGLSQICNIYNSVSDWEKALALEYLSDWYERRAREKDKETA